MLRRLSSSFIAICCALGATPVCAGDYPTDNWSALDVLYFYKQDGTANAAYYFPPAHGFIMRNNYGPGKISPGWTSITCALGGDHKLFFYNAADQSGAVGQLTLTGLTTLESYKAGTLGHWTHVVGLGWGRHSGNIFFYDAATGAAKTAFGFATPTDYPAGRFSTGWQRIVDGPFQQFDGPAFYKGGAQKALAFGYDPTPQSFSGDVVPDFPTKVSMTPHRVRGGISQVAAEQGGLGAILFYGRDAGTGWALAVVDGKLVSSDAINLSPWTAIVGFSQGLYFYNSADGVVATAHFELATRSVGPTHDPVHVQYLKMVQDSSLQGSAAMTGYTQVVRTPCGRANPPGIQ